MRKLLKKLLLDLIGRRRLIHWIAEDSDIEDTYTFNFSANTFSILGDRIWQMLVLTNITKHRLGIANDYFENYIANGNHFCSQLGQDCLIDTILKKKTGGVFIEIGVGTGTNLSNTHFFEKQRGWSGLLCEPARQFHDSIKNNRSALLVDKAVFAVGGRELNFTESVDNGELSSLEGYSHNISSESSGTRSYQVSTITFNDLCDTYLPGKVIDYLSVDTEGSELEILSSIDFQRHRILSLTVEHNFDQKKYNEICHLLEKNGFVEYGRGVFKWDAVFINKEIMNSL